MSSVLGRARTRGAAHRFPHSTAGLLSTISGFRGPLGQMRRRRKATSLGAAQGRAARAGAGGWYGKRPMPPHTAGWPHCAGIEERHACPYSYGLWLLWLWLQRAWP